MSLKGRIGLLKLGVWVICLVPVAWVLYRLFLGDGLGANPIEEAEHWSGLTALTVLIGALAVTPIRRLTGLNGLQKVRRLVGLFAFFYVVVHFLIWLGVDQFFEWEWIAVDLTERPYIIVGFIGFVMLTPLAVTSTKGWIRRLGRRWVRLHRLIYVVAPLGVIHYFWVTKADDRGPTIAAVILGVLLVSRVWFAAGKKRRRVRASLPEASAAEA